MADPANVGSDSPWHAAFPEPRNKSPAGITREELLARMQAGQIPGKDFLLVDLRRNDHEGGTIRGSLNLPAQSLYPSLPTLYELCKSAGVKDVFFYCGKLEIEFGGNGIHVERMLIFSKVSSQGRGTRAAGWLDDLISDRGAEDVRSMILIGGIKGWATAGDEFTRLMVGYDPSIWTRFKKQE